MGDPLGFTEWKQRRSPECGSKAVQDPKGRGLWCKTNLENEFEVEATRIDDPPDSELPQLPPPEMLTGCGAMLQKMGQEVHDVTGWAKRFLQEELIYACATDKTDQAGTTARVDVIASEVNVGDGNAGMAPFNGNLICAYRFSVKVSFCVNVAERLDPSKAPTETRFMGVVEMSEVTSGIEIPALPGKMKTSLLGEKPQKQHLALIRPLLVRFEKSVAYFWRRFERRLLLRTKDKNKS